MSTETILLKPDTLWQRTLDTTKHALQCGALRPIVTKSTFINDAGIDFLIRIVSSLKRKAEDKKNRRQQPVNKDFNPFLPYDKDMFVADISDSHVCILNKFNVIDHHLLIITRDFEDQERLLTLIDFEAIWACLNEFEGLGFYNGGVIAGASQRHKHLQMIPVPIDELGTRIPVEQLFMLESANSNGKPGTIAELPFNHSLLRFNFGSTTTIYEKAARTHQQYQTMIRAIGLNSDSDTQSAPYNLLITREWMFLVPRAKEFYHSISVNSIGFAGGLLVMNDQQMQVLKDNGPMAALKSVAVS